MSIYSSDSSDSSDKPTRHTSKRSKISFVLGAGPMEDAIDETINTIDINYLEIIYIYISTLFEF